MTWNLQRPAHDFSALSAAFAGAGTALERTLGPRGRRRVRRDGVLGAGALAAMIAAANASEGAGDAQIAAADADAAGSLDDILSFAALCATSASGAESELHALHDGAADGHEAHAFFEAAFASSFDSSLCGGEETAHQGHAARASAAHEAHTDDHAAAMTASAHAGHDAGDAHAASGEHAAAGAEADHHEETGAEAHAHAGAAIKPFAAAGHGAHEAGGTDAQTAAGAPSHDGHESYVLSALAGAPQNAAGDDDGDLTAGLDALLGQNDATQTSAAEAPAASHDAHAYSSPDYAAQDLPPATIEV